MSEFHDDYPQYELMAHHSEEEGKVKRKKLWRVFWIMLAITLVELAIGTYAAQMGLLTAKRETTFTLKLIFVGLTIVKAAYIVLSFMHLGDEKKVLKWIIIAPYTGFIIYLAAICTTGEGTYSMGNRMPLDPSVVKQIDALRNGGGHHEGGAKHEEKAAEHHEEKSEGGEKHHE